MSKAGFVIVQHPPAHGAQFAYEHPGGGQLVGYQSVKWSHSEHPLRIQLINYDGEGDPTVSLSCVEETDDEIHPNLVYKWDAETVFTDIILKDEGPYGGSVRQSPEQVDKHLYDIWFKIQRRPVRPRGTIGAPDADAVRIKINVKIGRQGSEDTFSLGDLYTMPIYNKYASSCGLTLLDLTSYSGQPGDTASVAVLKGKALPGESYDEIPVEGLQIYFVDNACHKISLPDLKPQTAGGTIFHYTVPGVKDLPGLFDNVGTVRVKDVNGKSYAAYRFRFFKISEDSLV